MNPMNWKLVCLWTLHRLFLKFLNDWCLILDHSWRSRNWDQIFVCQKLWSQIPKFEKSAWFFNNLYDSYYDSFIINSYAFSIGYACGNLWLTAICSPFTDTPWSNAKWIQINHDDSKSPQKWAQNWKWRSQTSKAPSTIWKKKKISVTIQELTINVLKWPWKCKM